MRENVVFTDEEYKEFTEATMHQAEQLFQYMHGERNEPDDPITVLKRHIQFFDADWIGLIDFDLDLGRWSTKIFYNANTGSSTETLIQEAESVDQAIGWVRAIKERKPIVIEDIEEIRDLAPEEYAMYKRLKVESVIAVPYMNCGTGLVVVRNPKRFKNNYLALNLMSYIITNEIISKQRREKMESHTLQDEPKSEDEVYIKLLGEMEIVSKDLRLKGNDIPEPIRLMIAFLAAHPDQKFNLDQLKDICRTDAESLKNYIYRFRKKWKSIRNLDNDKCQLLVTVEKDYTFNPDLAIDIDVNHAVEMVKVIEDTADAVTKINLLKQFYMMYRGDFLQGEITDSMVVANARYHYKGIYIEQMNTMLKLMFDLKDYAGVTKYAGNILALNPRSVDIHCWRMLALFKLGKLDLMKGAQDNAEQYLDEKEYILLQNMVEAAVRRETSLDFTRGKYELIFQSMHLANKKIVGLNPEIAVNM